MTLAEGRGGVARQICYVAKAVQCIASDLIRRLTPSLKSRMSWVRSLALTISIPAVAFNIHGFLSTS